VVETQAVLSIAGGLAGNVEATWTANVRVAEAPAARVPRLNVQELPALLFGVQAQPGDELPGRKAVNCGTVS
jgi:hypothetical protein